MGLSAALNLAALTLFGCLWPPAPPAVPPHTQMLLLTLLPPPTKRPHRTLTRPVPPPKLIRRATPLPPAPRQPPRVAPVAAHAGGARPRPRPSPHYVALPRPSPDLPQNTQTVPRADGSANARLPGDANTAAPSAKSTGTGNSDGQGSGQGKGAGSGTVAGPFGIQGSGGGGDGPRHVVYLLDISGSMTMTEGKFGGESRLQRAREELDAQLKSLGPGETFSLIAFADSALPFRPQLVPADAPDVQDAEGFLSGLKAEGDTDLEDALDAAFKMRGVNVIYVITDGVPRTPDHDYTTPTDFEALADRVDDANRQGARIFTIGLLGPNPDGTDQSAQASALLERIASDSGGTFKPISLDAAPQDSGTP